MKVMNVAVVGAGIYGINHVNAYTWNPNTNLVAVCDLNKRDHRPNCRRIQCKNIQ